MLPTGRVASRDAPALHDLQVDDAVAPAREDQHHESGGGRHPPAPGIAVQPVRRPLPGRSHGDDGPACGLAQRSSKPVAAAVSMELDRVVQRSEVRLTIEVLRGHSAVSFQDKAASGSNSSMGGGGLLPYQVGEAAAAPCSPGDAGWRLHREKAPTSSTASTLRFRRATLLSPPIPAIRKKGPIKMDRIGPGGQERAAPTQGGGWIAGVCGARG